ncbi:hypothetical protein CFC21_012455, partial [Triticum aestivum]
EPSPKKTSEFASWTKDTSRRRQDRPRTRGEAKAGGHVAHTATRSSSSRPDRHGGRAGAGARGAGGGRAHRLHGLPRGRRPRGVPHPHPRPRPRQ